MNIRQGNVLLKKIEKLPDTVKEVKDKTMAYGEVTGHSHRFTNPDNITRFESEGKLYLQVFNPAPLIHEEHHEIIILPGIYEQIKEREYDYPGEEIKAVTD